MLMYYGLDLIWLNIVLFYVFLLDLKLIYYVVKSFHMLCR
jgi:hypothetical protein